ncbi:hypothetical protein KVG29_04980 [Caldicoprobacter algeriensis]|nr:hypothetical protein [Caldicoprobacter algeriensis]
MIWLWCLLSFMAGFFIASIKGVDKWIDKRYERYKAKAIQIGECFWCGDRLIQDGDKVVCQGCGKEYKA